MPAAAAVGAHLRTYDIHAHRASRLVRERGRERKGERERERKRKRERERESKREREREWSRRYIA